MAPTGSAATRPRRRSRPPSSGCGSPAATAPVVRRPLRTTPSSPDRAVAPTAHGAHDYEDDPRNRNVLIHVNGTLVPRAEAVVSVFDAGFVLGDGIWEGLRVHAGHPAFLDQHLDRLWEGAAAIALDIGLTRTELTERIYETLRANEMADGVHVRLMVTRGPKSTPYQDPRFSAGPATVVIIAEHKDPLPA